ncbi:Quinohemoprotein alcohol dehydrogenase ADH-IIG [Dissostichus eleginoides]|uniref:Quinohemoprotein alcohol dehydrogenase ADH-IIG n=1 Tax=Dissostichus eleginoides TaxID=100907 RepID=A0AAD9BQP7_DISEL|nr:Quinohemoprotein alcohol dehydrogenase ADH-IIG [Dissostichus eleginoides]
MQLRFRLTHYGTMQGDAWDWQVTGSHCSLLTDLPLDRLVSPVLLTEGQPVPELTLSLYSSFYSLLRFE